MGGIRSDFGKALLNAITCNGVDMYNTSGTSQVINYMQYVQSYDSGGQPSTIQTEFMGYRYNNIFTDVITNSYLGLLYDKPQYHMGGGTVQHPSIAVMKIEDNGSGRESVYTSKNFLDIKEIPNHSHNNLLSNDSGSTKHYWPEYSRALLGNLVKNTDKGAYYPGVSYMTGATIETSYEIINNKAYPTHQLVNSNSQGRFLGENSIEADWPAIKHFGLFRNETDENNNLIYQDAQLNWYYIEQNPDLYFWGELNESDDWYHQWTYSAGEWSIKRYQLWYKVDNVWIRNTAEDYDSSKTYYERLGIIIHQDESASFSTGAFKLVFEDNTHTLENTGV